MLEFLRVGLKLAKTQVHKVTHVSFVATFRLLIRSKKKIGGLCMVF